MKLNSLIKFAKYKKGLNTSQLARELGVARSTVIKWESGDFKALNAESKKLLADYLEIDIDNYLDYDLVKPILGTVKAGYDLMAEENIQDYIEVSPAEAKQGDYFVEVKGDSMIGARIYEGDLLYVKSVNDVQSGEIAIILINGDEATVKKVIKKGNVLILEAANPDIENRYYTADEVEEIPIKIIGKVISNKISFS